MERADRRALAFIQATIAPNLRQLTTEAGTASQVYGLLNAHYRDDSLTNQIYLKKSVFMIRQDDTTPSLDLTAQILSFQNQLRLIGKPLEDLDLIVVLLASLNTRLADWIEKVEKWREVDLVWDGVTKSLFREEARQSCLTREAETNAVLSTRPPRPSQSLDFCQFCKKTGHVEAKCFRRRESKRLDCKRVLTELSNRQKMLHVFVLLLGQRPLWLTWF